MRELLPAILFISILFLLGLCFAPMGMTYQKVNSDGCLKCHPLNTFHYDSTNSPHKGVSCDKCHTGAPGGGSVYSSACAVCHPRTGPGVCPLVNFHDPGKGATCLTCHAGPPTNCASPATTTTAPPVTTTTVPVETTTTTTLPETTTTVPTTTTTTPSGCPFAQYLQSQDDIHALRMARNVLLKTPYGTLLTTMYYKHALEIVTLLEKHPELQQELRDIVNDNRTNVWQYITTGKVNLSDATENRVIEFLTVLKDGASTQLSSDIDKVIHDIKNGCLLNAVENANN